MQYRVADWLAAIEFNGLFGAWRTGDAGGKHVRHGSRILEHRSMTNSDLLLFIPDLNRSLQISNRPKFGCFAILEFLTDCHGAATLAYRHHL